MLIRRANPGDAGGIAAVHVSAIRQLCASVYDPSQLESWVSGKRAEQYLAPIARNPFFVAVSGTNLVGFSELDAETGEVRAVYVHPDHVRQHVGARLLLAVEFAARERSLARLHLHASLNAVSFYEAQSYIVDGEASVALQDGTLLPCMAMHKDLDR